MSDQSHLSTLFYLLNLAASISQYRGREKLYALAVIYLGGSRSPTSRSCKSGLGE